MVEGLLIDRDYHRNNHAEQLYLQRKMVTTLMNVIQSFDKTAQPIDELEVYKIPEFDAKIRKLREKEKQELEQRADKVLEKYKNIEKRLKGNG